MPSIQTNERVSAIGKTRSGKSVAIRHLLWLAALATEARTDAKAKWLKIFILVTKREPIPLFRPKFFPGTTLSVVTRLDQVLRASSRVVVFEPKPETKGPDLYARYFKMLYDRTERTGRAAITYVDEMNAVTGGRANGGSKHFKLLYTEGGGMDIGAWASVQDGVNLQREFLSQAEHILAFPLKMPSDRKKLSEILDTKLPPRYPDKRGFYYASPSNETIYVPSIQHLTQREVIL